jgi:hypothetical protein
MSLQHIKGLSICLAVTVEADLVNINTKNKSLFDFDNDRYYETEALSLFTSWRKNAGKLKDVPIYALCMTGNEPSLATQEKFKELDVTYISEYQKETESFLSGFWNIPLGGVWFERNLEEDIIIKLDLDMEVLKPLPGDLFGLPDKGSVVGVFDTYQLDLERTLPPGATIQTNTCLIISYRESMVYTEWYEHLKVLTEKAQNPSFLEEYNMKLDDIEEFSFDDMLYKSLFSEKVSTVEKFQLGEHYPVLSNFSEEEVGGIYFWHEHYKKTPRKELVREKIEFLKRTK